VQGADPTGDSNVEDLEIQIPLTNPTVISHNAEYVMRLDAVERTTNRRQPEKVSFQFTFVVNQGPATGKKILHWVDADFAHGRDREFLSQLTGKPAGSAVRLKDYVAKLYLVKTRPNGDSTAFARIATVTPLDS
jgi:hypothetical protein